MKNSFCVITGEDFYNRWNADDSETQVEPYCDP